MLEAKTWYTGNWWHQGVLVSKCHWQRSRNSLVLNSLSNWCHSWKQEDYHKAVVKAYFSTKSDFNMENVEDEDAPHFEFKAEWEILQEHQNWHANLLLKQEKKRKSGGGPQSSKENLENTTNHEMVPPLPICLEPRKQS